MSISAGDLRDRVTIQRRKSSAEADAGGLIDETAAGTWETYFTCWAQLIPSGAREFFGADQVQATIAYQVRVRACTETRAVVPTMRIKWKERYFNIAGMPFDPTGRRDELRINVTEGI